MVRETALRLRLQGLKMMNDVARNNRKLGLDFCIVPPMQLRSPDKVTLS